MHDPTLGRIAAFLTGIAVVIALAGCDEAKTSPTGAADPATGSAPPSSAAAEPPRPKGPPELMVDNLGPYLAGQRVDLKHKEGPEKLTKRIRELALEQGKPVTLLADKKAKPSDVAAVVTALGEAGVPKVIIKTDGRNDLPKEISVTPEGRISSPPGCAVTTMVTKDLSTAIWPFKGGMGKRQRKGLAGPDLSNTGQQLTREFAACNADVVFFSADDEVSWEMAHNLAGTVLVSDEKKKIATLVLLRNAPVAGRPVRIGEGS